MVEVPLTKLVGRTIEGETERTTAVGCDEFDGWWWVGTTNQGAFSVDLDTGLVRVYAEGDES